MIVSKLSFDQPYDPTSLHTFAVLLSFVISFVKIKVLKSYFKIYTPRSHNLVVRKLGELVPARVSGFKSLPRRLALKRFKKLEFCN
jgi:hypothetical protein